MTQFHSDAAEDAGSNVDTFTAAYITTIYFTDTGDGDQPDSDVPLSAEAIEQAKADCADFQKVAAAYLAEAYERNGYNLERAAHDFWFTRNGHGVGFWDRDELEDGNLGEVLDRLAKQYGQCNSYLGEDGELHLF